MEETQVHFQSLGFLANPKATVNAAAEVFGADAVTDTRQPSSIRFSFLIYSKFIVSVLQI